ncbi:hypothetical protein GCM10020000_03840 [Streptomyces olivoverticillatus]
MEPWDDDVAVLRWQEALMVPPEQRMASGPGALTLPRWDEAADALGDFYHRILAA